MSDQDKISVIKDLQFLETLNNAQIEVARDFSEEVDLDVQDEEEKFLTSVAESILRLGKWCLQIYGNSDKMLPDF